LDFIGLFLFIILMQPVIERGMMEAARARMLVQMENKRSSRVILLVQRQETMNILGLPLFRYISMEDSESVLRAIRLTDPDVPIDLIIHSPGSLTTAAEQIAAALVRHKARVTVFVPHYAMAGAALIALAASELVMNRDAVLGALEPQIEMYPAASIVSAVERKSAAEVEDKTWMLADKARKARKQMKQKVLQILSHRMEREDAERITDALTSGQWTLDYPLSVDELKQMGVAVSTEMPIEVYRMMNLYPQPKELRPSVDYIPAPYFKPDHANRE